MFPGLTSFGWIGCGCLTLIRRGFLIIDLRAARHRRRGLQGAKIGVGLPFFPAPALAGTEARYRSDPRPLSRTLFFPLAVCNKKDCARIPIRLDFFHVIA